VTNFIDIGLIEQDTKELATQAKLKATSRLSLHQFGAVLEICFLRFFVIAEMIYVFGLNFLNSIIQSG
jgi:hypothetical protein